MNPQTVLVISILAVASTLVFPGGRAQAPSCLKQLVPCLNYLNGTKDPPSTCCDPLKSVIKSDPKCLCSLISNKVATKVERAGVDVSKAQELPGRCGERVNPIACLASSSPDSNDAGRDCTRLSVGVGAVMALSSLAVLLI